MRPVSKRLVDFGEERNGYHNDIHPNYYNIAGVKKSRRLKIQDAIKPGAELLVQVHKEAVGNKGAALTTDITMPGRYLVFTPLSNTTGVSRKIENEKTRKRLKEVVNRLDIPEEGGVLSVQPDSMRMRKPCQWTFNDFFALGTYTGGIRYKRPDKSCIET